MLRIAILLSLTCAPVMAQVRPVSQSFTDFSGGLNNYGPTIYIDKNESPDMLNVEVDNPPGILRQRNGYFTCGNTPSGNTATALYEYSKSDGSRALIVSDNSSVWQTFDCVTFSTITTGLSALDVPSFKTIRDKLWIVNGSTFPVTWDGTTATSLDGTGSKPSVPKGRYIEFWKDIVWVANTPTDPSVVFYCDPTDDEGNPVDPSISSAAWANSLNAFYVSREDGSGINGLKAYRDNLYPFKYTGIWKIVYESDFNNALTKSVSSTGSQFNGSIVEMDDNLLYFAGRDGIYAFDGVDTKRISDKWQTTFDSLKQPFGRERFKIWDTPTDFSAGTLSNLTANDDGSLSLTFSTTTLISDTFTQSPSTWTCINGTTRSDGCPFISMVGGISYSHSYTITTTFGNYYSAQIYAPNYSPNINSNASGIYTSTFTISAEATRSNTNPFVSLTNSIAPFSNENYIFSGTGQITGTKIVAQLGKSINNAGTYRSASLTAYKNGVQYFTGTSATTATSYFCSSSTMTYNSSTKIVTWVDSSCGVNLSITLNGDIGLSTSTYFVNSFFEFGNTGSLSGVVTYAGGTDNILSTLYRVASSTGQFTSEIYDIGNSITQWRTFGVSDYLNGQSIVYYIRSATSTYNLGLASFVVAKDGDIVSNSTSNVKVQWKSDFTTYDNYSSPYINSVSVNWREGDASKSPLGATYYKNRYWLVGSTTPSNDYNDLTMVKSRSPLNAWMPHSLAISALTIWNNNLYGAISNTSKIARLDYGDNDDGTAINSYWQSKDDTFANIINYKNLNQIIVDYSRSATNNSLDVSASFDSGTTWYSRTLDMTAGKYPRSTKILNYDTPQALNYRMRISNSKLDSNYVIYGLHSIATDSGYIGK